MQDRIRHDSLRVTIYPCVYDVRHSLETTIKQTTTGMQKQFNLEKINSVILRTNISVLHRGEVQGGVLLF